MGNLTDLKIRNWIKANERFHAKSDGNGLYLSYRKEFLVPRWIFRYQFEGKARVMALGTYPNVSLADARIKAQKARARLSDGFDVAEEKKQRKREQAKSREDEKNLWDVARLADEYLKDNLKRWEHSNIVRRRFDKDIKPRIGKKLVKEVRPTDIAAILSAINARKAPTVANDVLRWIRRMFDYALKREITDRNPASAFDLSDAGGKESSRERWLTQEELVRLFDAMRTAKGFARENYLTFKLLLLLAVRKQELTAAPLDEFDLENAVWHLPADRTKTDVAIDIPLSEQALDCLSELRDMAGESKFLLPARKQQTRMLPHIHENTLNVALSKVKAAFQPPGIAEFTIHDFRRTARTQMAALGVEPHIAERCLNHKVRGVAGTYDRHGYFEERREALQRWAAFLATCEHGDQWNVIPLRAAARNT